MCECDYTHTHLITSSSSSSEEIMENYQGDLADIIRSGSGPVTGTSSAYSNDLPPVATTWQFSQSDMNDFGHPFSAYIKDPLLPKPIIEETGAGIFSFRNNTIDHDQDLFIKKPLDQMNHCAAGGISIRNDCVNHMINGSSSNNCLMENSSRSVQISSPRNTGIKRRKGQAKKVVCIPAPTPVNSRSTGEIVPSDLWAWRKYGQKPIKGSPYPRGYYRCSSLKGCSARKQVERSRTDPNMLVITYTSEHNHPWPTQRNALAGSTRNTQAGSKNNSTVNASKHSPSDASNPSPNLPNVKEEEKESINIDNVSSSVDVGEKNLEEKLDIGMEEDGDQFSEGFLIPDENYRPVFPDDKSITYNNPHDQDLFADLGEINEGADPLKLLFSQGFTGDYQISHSFCFYD